MKYNILIISDLHWGVMEEDRMEIQYCFILEFIDGIYSRVDKGNLEKIDLIVVAGDYFDSQLNLNSRRAIKALDWFDTLYSKANAYNIPIRMIRGTLSHDADQMDVFRKYEHNLKIFTKCTSEETLPGLRCVYCPDEVMDTRDYILEYMDEILADNSVGFFHGSFDTVIKQDIDVTQLLTEEPEELMKLVTSVTFPMNYFQRAVRYCWVGGHWHDGNTYANVYYTGSPTRWIHGENESKGFGFLSVDTDSDRYFYKKIVNPIAPQFNTFNWYPEDIEEGYMINNASALMDLIDAKVMEYETMNVEYNIRIMIYDEENRRTCTNTCIETFKDHYLKNKHVVIRIKSRDKGKKKKQKPVEETVKDYSFIHDKNVSVADQIREFIKVKMGVDIPIDYIEEKIKKNSI